MGGPIVFSIGIASMPMLIPAKAQRRSIANNVPAAYIGFSAHSSPLGFEYLIRATVTQL